MLKEIRPTGLILCSNALVCVSFDHLKVCEVKEAPDYFVHHFHFNLSLLLFFVQGAEVLLLIWP